MTIDIIIPSHRREYRIRDMCQLWIDRSENKNSEDGKIAIWVACEYEDQHVYAERLRDLQPFVHVVPDNYGCWVEAINKVASTTKSDVMICAADDVVPCQGYDSMIMQGFRENYPKFDGVIRANDLIHSTEEPSNTHPVVGREYYNKFGYVFYPGYFALWSDTEFAHTSQMINRQFNMPTLVLEHLHHSIGKTPRDITHEKPLSQNASGERLFNRRKEEGFSVFINDRLMTPKELFDE